MNYSLSHHVTLRRASRTKHIPTAMQICVCQRFSVRRNATGELPVGKREAAGRLQGVWDKHAPDTPWAHRSTAPSQLQQLWKHLLLVITFFVLSEKKTKKQTPPPTTKKQRLLWCHEAKYKYVIIPLACVQIWSYFHDWPDFGCVCVNITPTYVHTHACILWDVWIYTTYILCGF